MKFKFLKYLTLPLLLVPCGCNNPTVSKEVVINGFESVEDLYKTKLIYKYSSHGVDCSFDINTDKKYVHDGNASLKMVYTQPKDNTGKYSYFYQPISLSNLGDRDISDLDKFGIWLYNDNDVDTTISMALIITDKMATNVDDDILLPKKEWTYAELNLSKLIVNNSYETFLGFGFLIDEIEGTFYADNWTVKFGATETEEDKKYKTTIDDVSRRIPLLPDESSPEYVSSLRSIAADYYTIKTSYRSAVIDYKNLEKKFNAYITKLNEKIQKGDTVYHFNDPIGMSQASIDFDALGLDLTFDKDEKHLETDYGSMKVSCSLASGWAYVKAKTDSISFSKFDKLSFYVKNDLDKKIALCVSWNQEAINIPAKSDWVKIELTTNQLGSTVEIEFCGNKNGIGGYEETIGDVYFSNFIVE